VTKLGLASTMMVMIAEDACSMEGTAADNPCRVYGSWIRDRRWSPAVAAADAVASSATEMPPLLDQKASSCRSTCAYRSSARGRLSSSAASTRFGPNDKVEEKGALSVGEIQKFLGMHRSWQFIRFLVEFERGDVAGLDDGRRDGEH
jgi:hypothetical protein